MDSASTRPQERQDEFDDERPDDAGPPDEGGRAGPPPVPPLGVGEWSAEEDLPPLPPEPFRVPGDVVTRMLCSTVHLKGSFADQVLGDLVDPTHRAMAPNWNIDTPMLVRHATQASGRRKQRDTELLGMFLVLVALEGLAVALLVTNWLSVVHAVLLGLAVWIGVYAVSFRIVWNHYSLIHRSALAAIGIKGADLLAEEPPPLAPEVEEALVAADTGNAILFSGGSPFIGSGEVVDRWTITVDIGTGARTADGGREVPERFDNVELHQNLTVAIPQAMGHPPRVGHRLYVVGGHALAVGGLFRSGPVPEDGEAVVRFRRPVPTVTTDVIRRFMDHPHQSARPYTFFELTAWDGQVVVTLFVRALVTYPTMFVEMAVCALRPPQGRYGEVGSIRLGPTQHRLPILRTVSPMTMKLLLGSPRRQIQQLQGARAYRLALKDLELTLKERFDVNFSAGPSLREEIARADNPLHYGWVDEEMFYRTFHQAAMESLRKWLVERHIDITDFERQQVKVTEKRMTNSRDIYGLDD